MKTILEWLAQPTTWLTVVGAGAISCLGLAQCRRCVAELALLALMTAIAAFTARVHLEAGTVSLYSTPLGAIALSVIALLRKDRRNPLELFGLAWAHCIVVDFAGMYLWGPTDSVQNLPIGIGGAGLGDGLFQYPAILCLGVALMQKMAQPYKLHA